MKRRFINFSFIFLILIALCLSLALYAEESDFSTPGARLIPAAESPDQLNNLMSAGGVIFHRTPNPVSGLRTVLVPENEIQIYLWHELLQDGQTQAFYTLSRDGSDLSGRVRETSYLVRLTDRAFDPLVDLQPVHFALEARPSNALYLVQFVTTPLPEFRSAIISLGGQVHRFLTDHTFVVEMPDRLRNQVAGLPYVRWVGEYHPEYRMEPFLRSALSGLAEPLETQRYSIMLCERDHARQKALGSLINHLGGTVHFTTPGAYRMEATLNQDQLLEVVHANEVQYVDRWGGPGEVDMNIVRQVGGADYLEGLTGWSGEGVRGEIFDTELRTTHQEWPTAPIIHSTGTTGSVYHGTSCYSINFAQGIDAAARGLLPDGQGIFYRYNESSQFGGTKSRYDINAELIDPAGPYYAVFQTASVGSTRTTLYTTLSAEVDDYLFLYPILSTQSQSNAGNQLSRPQAWAKNIVAVGGMYHYNTSGRSDDRWNFGASIGPAEDGRVKPDLAYFYDNIHAAYGSINTAYTEFGGTSAATPETSGHFGLMFQMWHEQVWAGHGGGASVFDSRPEMATAKALIINSAYRYDWTLGGPNGDIDRDVQGWGTADVGKLYDRAPFTMVIDESDVIAPLETRTYYVTVSPGETELSVTMAYTDPMGTVGAAEHRINDLSLRVTSPSSTVYWGNNGLRSGNFSTSGGSSNTIDTVENVFIQNPASGTWTVEVLADEVVEDSHTETPEIDADFGLVISGVSAGNLPPNIPFNPDPANGAVNVDINADLIWGGGDPNSGDSVYYDVYFGTGPTPPFVERIGPYPATQTTITYDPGPLGYNTAYSWQIIAEDDQAESTAGPVWTFTTMELNQAPYTPSNPDPVNGAVDVDEKYDLTWDGGDPNTADSVYYDVYFGTSPTPPFVERIGPYPATQTSITYDPGNMSNNTQHYWQIIAEDSHGALAAGPVWTFTTIEQQTQQFLATADLPVQNGGITGDFNNTHNTDNVYEGIMERESGGKPSNRYSYLEHKWTINVTGGYDTYAFYLEAYHTANGEGDDFTFAYSTDDAVYTNMFTVTKTADDNGYQAFYLPNTLSGTVYIRVMDTDQSPGNRVRDTVYIDHMYIEGSGAQPNDPPDVPANPDPINGATDVDVNTVLSWDGGDPDAGDSVRYEIYLGTTAPPPLYDITAYYPATQTRITYDPGTLSENTLYYWNIIAYDTRGKSTAGPIWNFTTGTAPTVFYANQDIAVKNGNIAGDYTSTHDSDDVYEGIMERESGGKPSNRYSYLEHKWTIDVVGGSSSYVFNLEAYHTLNSEGDDFIFAYSTNDVTYTNMLTVTKIADDNTDQTYDLPNTLSGTIYIRVVDTDQTAGSRNLDTINIDHMYIEAIN